MGCDMHVIIEQRNNTGKWEMVARPDVVRYYALFANLAGVRNDGKVNPISNPKGWPDDLSLGGRVLKEYWDLDGHSESYLTISELASHIFNYDGGILETPYWLSELIHEGATDKRIVFCFDN